LGGAVGAAGFAVAGRKVGRGVKVGDAAVVGDASGVDVLSGVAVARGVKVARGVRVGVAVPASRKAVKVPASHASNATTTTRIALTSQTRCCSN
jgi:hypothetical protein